MNFKESFSRLWGKIEKVDFSEKLSFCTIKLSILQLEIPNEKDLDTLIQQIFDRDQILLTLTTSAGNHVVAKSHSDISEFLEDSLDALSYGDNLEATLTLEIKKDTSELVSIYDFEEFQRFLTSRKTGQILNLIADFKNSNNQVSFQLIDDNFSEFESSHIHFSLNISPSSSSKYSKISDSCHFGNRLKYPFNPTFFYFEETPDIAKPLKAVFDKLAQIFFYVSVFDISHIEGNNFYAKLNGYKTRELSIDLDDVDLSELEQCMKIYYWIYSESEKAEDKLGLARNVLSISFDSFRIGPGVLESIQSAYKTYLKENVDKYLELRSKILDEVSWISQKVGEVLKDYLSSYQRSVLSFISFFISVFLFKALRSSSISFGQTETVFAIAFLLLSIVFLIYSQTNLKTEKKRLKRKYMNIKKRYQDVLLKMDIEKILDSDSEFNYEMSYLENRSRNIRILWISTIIILLIATAVVSTVIDWNVAGRFFLKTIEFCIPNTLN